MKDANKVKKLLQALKAQMTTEKELQIVKFCEEKLEATKEIGGEEWRDIAGYEGFYKVSNFGRIKSYHNGVEQFRKPVFKEGYFVIVLYKGGKHKQFFVHVLVARAFIDNPDGKPIVNHKDGNKLHCHVDNLEWVTYSENILHAYRTELMSIRRGTSCKNSKLTAEDVRFIRENYIPGDKDFGQSGLARRFNVSVSTIYTAVKKIRYKDVD